MELGVTTLVLNCGSSSVKYALFSGEVEVRRRQIDHADGVTAALDEIADRPTAVGHRLVHGGPAHRRPVRIDDAVLASLHEAIPFAPLHLPIELAAIAAVRRRFGEVPQVACFDTAFHEHMPEVARRLALPAPLFDAGIQSYGFHGLSYEYLASVVPTRPRAVYAHLGNGASMVAVRDGLSIDTTMGFTPTGGLVMGTRSGDLDPGVLLYLLARGYDHRALARLVDHEAGLLALSGATSDMRELLATCASDPRAALAVDVFCYRAKKALGGFVAVLGGLDLLVFTGGIGESAAHVRQEICAGLGGFGISLDHDRNATSAPSIGDGACEVRVIKTDEAAVIARHTRALVYAGGSVATS